MRPTRSLPVLVVCALVTLPSVSRAVVGVPDPFNSTVPVCLTVCPSGDLTIVIVVRDLANNPVGNSMVVLDVGACPAFTMCPIEPSDAYVWDPAARRVIGSTDVTGTVRFSLRAGGVCGTANGVSVYADGVFLAGRTVASPDQNGDLFVNAVDQGIANAKLGMADPTADFDCDGTVAIADLAILQVHQSHGCLGPTATRSRSWGGLKIIYR